MQKSQINHIFECCKNGETEQLLEALESFEDSRIVDERQNSVLATALKNGDWQTAETLIDNNHIYFHPNKPGLIAACQCKKDDATGIQLVLKLGADIDSQDLQQRTALMTVCLLGHINKAQELIENRANVSLQDMYGNTTLMDAAQSKNKNMVEFLLKQNPDIDQVNKQGETALIVELQQKSPVESIITQLLEAGSNPEIVDNNKKSAWLIAKQKHPKIAKLIETHLNKVNQIELPFFTIDTPTPQTNKTIKSEQEVIDNQVIDEEIKPETILIEESNPMVTIDEALDEDLNNKNRIEPNMDSLSPNTIDDFEPPLYLDTEIVSDLISDSEVNLETETLNQTNTTEDNTAAIETSSDEEKPKLSAIDEIEINNLENKLLNKENSNLQDTNTIKAHSKKPYVFTRKAKQSSQNEWFNAAKTGNLGGLNRMIIEGIDIDCIDNKGCTALIRASGHSRRAVVSFLLQQNANIEARSLNGSTALSSSIIGDCRRVAGLLLENKADVNALGPSDYSYVTIAAAQWNEAMLSILCRHGGDISVLNELNQTLLHIVTLAAEYYNNINKAKTSIQFLIDHGLDINSKDNNGNTALMILCGTHKTNYQVDDRNIASIAHCLIKMGAAAAMTNNAGNSALDACKQHKLQQTKGVLMNALSWND